MKLLTQRWHITGAPWSDGNHVTAGAEDPHAGTFVLSIENDDFDLSERVDICDHIVRLHNEHLASGQRLRELDLALAALSDVKPLANYGLPGTYDTVQARRQRALAQAEQALLNLRRELAPRPDGVPGQKGGA